MITKKQKLIIKKVVGKYKPVLIGVFGSYARNEQNDQSDIDILVDFESKLTLLDLIGLEQELSEILGIKVDLVTLNSLNESLRPYVEKELIRIT